MRALLIITVFILSNICLAQQNAVFLELGGNGGFASLNYEWQLTNTPHLSLRTGLGATFFEFEKEEPAVGSVSGCALCGVSIGAPRVSLTIPLSIQYLFDLQNNNYVETGVGSTWQLSKKSIFVFHAVFGFRRHFGNDSKWMWKVSFTPILGVAGDKVIKDSEPTI